MEKPAGGNLKLTWKEKAATAEISSDCGAISVGAETLPEAPPDKLKAIRVRLKIEKPVLKGGLKVKISPEG